MSFLVTGADGFIGRAVVRLLQDKATSLTRRDVDLRDRDAVRTWLAGRTFDYVIHLAGSAERRWDMDALEPLLQSNAIATAHLLDAVRFTKGFVHVGTLDEYGAGPIPFSESQAPAPISPYAIAKLAAGHVTRARGGTHVRLALVYGPGQSSGFFVSQLLAAAANGQELAMTAGEQVRDWIWLEDAAEGLVRIVTCGALRGEVVNLCTGVGTALKDVPGLLGKEVRVQLGAIPYRSTEVFESTGSVAKLVQYTGWRPGTPLKAGLQLLVQHEL